MSRSLLTNETSELDLLDQRPFDQTDFDILKSYEAVVDGLAMLIGSHCEIVLHSLQDLKCSAIRIANGEHTGRQIGSPITDLALRMLHDMGLTYHNVQAIARIPEMHELNIGHAIIGRAVMSGLKEAVAEMKRLMQEARA